MKGDPGESGLRGPQGDKGEIGLRGPSDAFSNTFFQTAVPAFGMGNAQPYARTLEPGSYVFMATLRVFATAANTNVQCSLIAGNQGMDEKNLDLDAIDDRKVLTLLAARTLDVPTEIRLACSVPGIAGPGYNISSGRVVALQVAAIH